ncbi:glycosyltransferase family 4 protein [Marinomonas communis]|uniref:Glycosyltransferase involved in cell wall biosynthesis n=1 Tax=Marinomonas communis TaxID=28254 RepID=A0A4R6X2I3_9GAMM|nr:glycosyltransferase family 4 protein [Marinomonas communis]TDR13076.1 glycosyltransferase involved in cell wall biosynthesis [Marinomonas communis]
MREKKKILVFDFNIVWEILSGYSMLNQVLYDDDNEYCFIFNRHCQLSKILDDKGYEVRVIEYGCASNALKSLLQYLCFLIRATFLVYRISPDVIHANNAMAARLSVPIAKLCGKKILVHIRNPSFPPRTYHFIKYADRFLAVSNFVKNSFNSKIKSKTDVVYDCHESKLVNLEKNSNQITVAMSSRLSIQKGISNFVDLATRIQDCLGDTEILFKHCGGVPAKQNDLGFDPSSAPITWLGYIDNVDEFWKEADIAIIPSVGPEAFGRVVIEAMANGAIPIASKCGGPEEIIDDGVSGFLFDINDTDKLYDLVFKILIDPELRKEISKNAIDMAKAKYSNRYYIENVNQSYIKVADVKNC